MTLSAAARRLLRDESVAVMNLADAGIARHRFVFLRVDHERERGLGGLGEQGNCLDLWPTHWLWVESQRGPTALERARLDELLDLAKDTLEATRAYEPAGPLGVMGPHTAATSCREGWGVRAGESGLRPMVGVAKTVRRSRRGILRLRHPRLGSGQLDATNSWLWRPESVLRVAGRRNISSQWLTRVAGTLKSGYQ